jgi:uncharacterized protein (TIGR03067 family)
MKRLTALLGVVVITAAACGGDDEASKADLKLFQGKWKIVSLVSKGKTEEVSPKSIYTFEGNKNLYESGTYDILTLNAKASPKELTFDNYQKNGDVNAKGIKAIYAIEKGTLKICVNPDPKGERPKTFESTEKSGTRLIVLERVK